MRKGATTSMIEIGIMDRITSSNNNVKSKPPRQSLVAYGPNVLSIWEHGVES